MIWAWLGPLLGLIYFGMIVGTSYLYVFVTRGSTFDDFDIIVGAILWPVILPVVMFYCGTRGFFSAWSSSLESYSWQRKQKRFQRNKIT